MVAVGVSLSFHAVILPGAGELLEFTKPGRYESL